MLRSLLSNAYSAYTPVVGSGMRVLDVGAIYVNKLVPFHDRGCRCYGIEINEEMVEIAKSFVEHQNICATITAGSNREFGYSNASFDLLLSINTIHYEDNISGLVAQ
jgi:2-polyprenyl-3-methyl-5-hydroxy-6-metoxy-1,4-benzoquinol methylase